MKNALWIKTAASPIERRSFLDFLALTIATGGGIGYAPLVPATFGSLGGVVVYLAAQRLNESFTGWAHGIHLSNALVESARASFIVVFLIGLFLIGIWSATRVVKLTGEKDPRLVVVDEVLGQLIVLLFVPAALGWWTIAAGFLAFRFFDIWKPFPANALESLPNGLGVMADDVAAGFYAAALMSLLGSIYLAATAAFAV